jgi:predicted nucleic acid-binding protein
MTFFDIPAHESLFIDANTFVYHFGPHPVFASACTQLLARITRGEIQGFTSADVLSDVAHRLMTLEAMARLGWPYGGIAQRLRKHHVEIQKLALFRQAVDDIQRYQIQVIPVSATLVSQAAAFSQQYGLLSSDALIVAVMQDRALTHLASHDADFDRVPQIVRYASA